MTNLIKSWNGKTIRIRSDRYVSLTDMAQASGKLFADWSRLVKSNSYLETLSRSMGNPIDQLIETKTTGKNENRGTWGHPKVALRFAQWCSDEFAVQVDSWIDELLTTGKVSLANDSGKPAVLVYADRVMKLKDQLRYVPDDHWVVMQHCGHVLLEVERLGYLVGEYDLCDGSIGSHWGKYRKTVGLTTTPKTGLYKVNQCPEPIKPKAYHLDELKIFVKWLEKIYIPKHLPEYLHDRPKAIVKSK